MRDAVREVIEYPVDAGGGYSVILNRPRVEGALSSCHSVDVGDTHYLPEQVTHRTRDGLPLIAMYEVEHGWHVSVHTTNP